MIYLCIAGILSCYVHEGLGYPNVSVYIKGAVVCVESHVVAPGVPIIERDWSRWCGVGSL